MTAPEKRDEAPETNEPPRCHYCGEELGWNERDLCVPCIRLRADEISR